VTKLDNLEGCSNTLMWLCAQSRLKIKVDFIFFHFDLAKGEGGVSPLSPTTCCALVCIIINKVFFTENNNFCYVKLLPLKRHKVFEQNTYPVYMSKMKWHFGRAGFFQPIRAFTLSKSSNWLKTSRPSKKATLF